MNLDLPQTTHLNSWMLPDGRHSTEETLSESVVREK